MCIFYQSNLLLDLLLLLHLLMFIAVITTSLSIPQKIGLKKSFRFLLMLNLLLMYHRQSFLIQIQNIIRKIESVLFITTTGILMRKVKQRERKHVKKRQKKQKKLALKSREEKRQTKKESVRFLKKRRDLRNPTSMDIFILMEEKRALLR